MKRTITLIQKTVIALFISVKATKKIMCLLVILSGVSLAARSQNTFPSSGNVGLGTTTPSYPLHIVSSELSAIRVDDNNAYWSGMYINNNSSGQPFYGYSFNNFETYAYHYLTPGGDWRLFVGSDDWLSVTSSGNVGVGTMSPGYKLDVIGGDIHAGDNLYIENTNAAFPGPVGRLDGWMDNLYLISSTPGSGLIFRTAPTDGSEQDRMILSKDGNLGIGTLAPTSKLEISTDGPSNPVFLNLNSNGTVISHTNVASNCGINFKRDGSNVCVTTLENNNAAFGGTLHSYNVSTNNGIAIGPFDTWFGSVDPSDGATYAFDQRFVFQGRIGMGTSHIPAGFRMAVAGKMISEEAWVQLAQNWPDYVFGKEYKLKTLDEVEQYVTDNHHLPEVPSAKEIRDNGLNMGDMSATLMKKVEELTLYLIEANKEIQGIKAEMKKLKEENQALRNNPK